MVFSPNALETVPMRTTLTETVKNPIQVYKISVNHGKGKIKNEPDRTMAFLKSPAVSN